MRRFHPLLLLIALANAACRPSASDGGGSAPDLSPQGALRLGSYNLSSGGNAFWRLDLADDSIAIWTLGSLGGALLAPSALERDGDTLTISLGEGDNLTFPLAHDGSFTGTFTLTNGTGSWPGTIAPDTTAPHATEVLSNGTWPPLPWDVLDLRVSEPVDPGVLAAAVAVNATESVPVLTTPSSMPASLGSSPRVLAEDATLLPLRWSQLVGKAATVDVGPLVDLAGNRSGTSSLALTFLDVPRRAALDFSDAEASFTILGDTSGLTFRGADPICETSNCLELGPFEPGVCGGASVVLATWIAAPSPVSSLAVRYRVLATNVASPVSPADLLSNSYGFFVAAEGAAPAHVTLDDDPAPLTPSTDLGFAATSEWRTARLVLPSAAANVGLEIRGGGPCGEDRIHASPVRTAALLVASIVPE